MGGEKCTDLGERAASSTQTRGWQLKSLSGVLPRARRPERNPKNIQAFFPPPQPTWKPFPPKLRLFGTVFAPKMTLAATWTSYLAKGPFEQYGAKFRVTFSCGHFSRLSL